MSLERNTRSRLGGLAGGLWVREEPTEPAAQAGGNRELARTLDEFCETVLWSGGEPPPGGPGRRVAEEEGSPGALRALASILAASEFDRVLFVSLCDTELERLLALVAYPHHDLVGYRSGRGQPIGALLCMRETVLAEARRQLSRGRADLESVLPALDTAFLDGRTD